MSRRAIAALLSVALGGGGVVLPLDADASDDAAKSEAKAEAKTRYDKGVKLYDDGAYEAALAEFQRAYDLHPSYKILYNIALIQQHLNDFVGALRSYQRYLEGGKGDIAALRRSEVEKSIAQIKPNVASLHIKVSAEGADVSIDDVSVGKAPLPETILVNAGRHRIIATKDKSTATKLLVVAGGDDLVVDLDVAALLEKENEQKDQKAPVAKPLSSSLDQPSDGPETKGTAKLPWVGIAITSGLAAGAIVTGVIALKASSTLARDRDAFGVPRGQLDDEQTKVKRWALITDVLAAGAVVVGSISLYFVLKKPSVESRDEKKSATTLDHVELGVGPASFVLRGAF